MPSLEYKMKKLKEKQTTILIASISLVAAFLFMDKNLTGNIILNNQYSFNWISLISIALIGCAIILFAYSLNKK